MRMKLRDEPWPYGQHDYRPCSVCGEPWRPWAGSRLPCHAKCLLTEQEQDALLSDLASPHAIAKRLGLSYGVVRASIAAAQKRREQ